MTGTAAAADHRPASRVAVVLCAHNGARFIGEQLDSIAGQTRAVDELHVFDWRSSDETATIVSDWMAHASPAIADKLLHRMDAAPGPARSFLHALASVASTSGAELVFVSDQDDLWLPDKVRLFMDSYQGADGPFDLAFSDVHVMRDSDRTEIPSFYGAGSPYRLPVEPADRSLLVTNPAVGMTMCVRREWLLRISSVFDLHWVMHDWALMLLCWATRGRARFIDRPLVRYRQHGGNALGAASARSVLSRAHHIRAHVAQLRRQISSVRDAAQRLDVAGDVVRTLDLAQSRLSQVKLAAGSRLLKPHYRAMLAGSLAVF